MKLAVAIASANRSALVASTVARLSEQSRLPDGIFVCTPDAGPITRHAPACWTIDARDPDVGTTDQPVLITAKQGLSAQRNRLLSTVIERGFNIVTFIDDDFLMSRDYLENVAAAFADNPDFVTTMGHVKYDGIRGPGYTFDEGVALLARLEGDRPDQKLPPVIDHPGAYGCNMSIRLSAVGALQFDERLPLYGWQEDIDFTNQLSRRGRIVQLSSLRGVHLGYRAGRQSGTRFGYSQISNPVYLMRKGTMPIGFGTELMLRNLLSNLSRSLAPEPHIDRRGRLRGNLLALRHVLTGRIEPEFILKL
ncbi:MAG TPA: glycosyltransferase [Hyphomicrobiaceae bacterium]|nr:glycosyltransferase [Hyphomicrobiaceae bacterium]